MGQRHNGEFGQDHEARFHEQYGGRARDRQQQGAGDEWRDERRWTGSREESSYDPDFGRGYESGRSTSDYPRFGEREYGTRERREPERGQYAGRGYDPSFERGGFGETGDQRRWQRGGSYEGGYEGWQNRENRGSAGWEGRGGYGDSRYGIPGDESREGRGFGDERRSGGGDYGRRFGGSSRAFGDANRSGWGQGSRSQDSEGRNDLGAHSGRGPKGYRRSDERIREEVCDHLTADSDVDASELSVTVKDSEVTLEGSVDSRWMKRRAEDCADGVHGVTQVHNRLQVRPQHERQRENGSAKGNAKAATSQA